MSIAQNPTPAGPTSVCPLCGVPYGENARLKAEQKNFDSVLSTWRREAKTAAEAELVDCALANRTSGCMKIAMALDPLIDAVAAERAGGGPLIRGVIVTFEDGHYIAILNGGGARATLDMAKFCAAPCAIHEPFLGAIVRIDADGGWCVMGRAFRSPFETLGKTPFLPSVTNPVTPHT